MAKKQKKSARRQPRQAAAKPNPKHTRRWPWLVAAAVVAAVTVAVLLFAWRDRDDPDAMLYVDGMPVYEAEYRWAMYQGREDVLSQMSTSGISLTKWDAQTELGVPGELVVSQAIQCLKEYHAVSGLAKERGYLADASFGALQAQLEKENEERAAAIAAGEIVTGLSHFELDQYVDYRANALRRQYCDDKSNPGMNLSEETLRQQYEQNLEMYARPDDMELYYLEIYTPSLDMAAEEVEALTQQAQALAQAAKAAGSLASAIGQFPELEPYYSTASINEDTYSAYQRNHDTLLSYAQTLESGSMSDLIEDSGWILLIECTQRVGDRYLSFETIRSVIERSLQESTYDALIQQRIADMKARYDMEKLLAYTLEQLG